MAYLRLRDPSLPNSIDNPYLMATMEEIFDAVGIHDNEGYYEFDPTTFETNYQKWKNNQGSYQGEVEVDDKGNKKYIIDYNKYNELNTSWRIYFKLNKNYYRYFDFKNLIIKNVYNEANLNFITIGAQGIVLKNLQILNAYIVPTGYNVYRIIYIDNYNDGSLPPKISGVRISAVVNSNYDTKVIDANTPSYNRCTAYFFGCSFNIRLVQNSSKLRMFYGENFKYSNCCFNYDTPMYDEKTRWGADRFGGGGSGIISTFRNCKFTGYINKALDAGSEINSKFFNCVFDFKGYYSSGTGKYYMNPQYISAPCIVLRDRIKGTPDDFLLPSGGNDGKILYPTRAEATNAEWLITHGFPIMYESDEMDDIFDNDG